jgi:hypothetical protein
MIVIVDQMPAATLIAAMMMMIAMTTVMIMDANDIEAVVIEAARNTEATAIGRNDRQRNITDPHQKNIPADDDAHPHPPTLLHLLTTTQPATLMTKPNHKSNNSNRLSCLMSLSIWILKIYGLKNKVRRGQSARKRRSDDDYCFNLCFFFVFVLLVDLPDDLAPVGPAPLSKEEKDDERA